MAIGGGQHEIWLCRDDGTRLKNISRADSFGYVRTLNTPGRFNISLPSDFNTELLKPDFRMEFWYKPPDGQLFLDFLGFIDGINYSRNNRGLKAIRVRGHDPIGLLERRIVAYDASSSEADKTDYADDMMKEVVDENLGSSAGASRVLSSDYFSIAGDASLAPSITKSFSRRGVLAVLQDIASSSYVEGTPLYFDIVRFSDQKFEFRTYIDQRGTDRREGYTTSPAIFGQEYGNLIEPELDYDWSGEVNVAYVAGQGVEDDRETVTRTDTGRSTRSIWSRREALVDRRDATQTATLNASGDRALDDGRPKQKFAGTITDTVGTQYGLHWQFGDRVTAKAFGLSFNGIVTTVNMLRDGSGKITITSRIEADR
jgi:hypothetical protein